MSAWTDDRAQDVMRRIEAAITAREHQRFERTTESELCKISVNLRGRLVDVVFLQNNVLRSTDRETLAAEVSAAITSAQSEAADVVAAIAAEHYAELG